MAKKYLSIFMAIILISALLASCTSTTTSQEHQLVTETTTQLVADEESFKLSYTQADSLNPYESKTLNNQTLENLVFDSLFTVDESFEAQPLIATSFKYTDSLTLSVYIKSGIVFSDGASLTADSVVYAFNQAKQSPKWKNTLSNFSSASAVSDTQIDFKLSKINSNAQSLLTFAIAKESDEKYPIGSGRYKFNEGNGKVFLEVNDKYGDFNPRFTKIILENVTSNESIENAINIGNISYAFSDLSDGSNIRINCNKKTVNINNLVYIGFNANGSSITEDISIRKAISLAIDRETLVKSSFQGYAKSATSVFNPSCSKGKETAVFSTSSDANAAKQAIALSKYSSDKLKIEILTNKNTNHIAAAQLIKNQLEAVGFTVSINSESTKEYKKRLKAKNFDIYIGETKIPDDLSLDSFFTSSGATNYGIDTQDGKTAIAYNEYVEDSSKIGNFILEFSEELPFVPVVYRQGVIYYSKSMHGDMQGYWGNYFSNIQDWYYN